MRAWWTALVAPLTFSSPAVSADWAGPFVGVSSGYSAASSKLGTLPTQASGTGTTFGARAGYLLENQNGVVWGVSADLDLATFPTSGEASFPGSLSAVVNPTDGITMVQTARPTWSAAITGRLGYDAGILLPYTLLGLTLTGQAETIHDYDTGLPSVGYTVSGETNVLSLTVGAGVEAKVNDQLAVFGEVRSLRGASSISMTGPSNSWPNIGIDVSQTGIQAGLIFRP
jgi:opacity protein-like surface antigen